MTEQEQALATENQRLKAQLAKRDKAERSAAMHAIHNTHVEYAEQLVAAGMKPVYAAAVIAALDFAEAGDTPLEFGDVDEHEPLSDGLKAIFKELTGSVSFAEQASKGRAGKAPTTTPNPLLADAEARAQR